MLPADFDWEELEVILFCLDFMWQHGWLTTDQEDLATAARKKIERYMRDECTWHGRVG